MSLSNKLINEARSYVGTQFRHQGRSKKSGVDCVGLIIGVARAVIPDFTFDFTVYDRDPDGHTLMRLANENMTEVPVGEAKHGDIFIMFYMNPSWPCHVAFIATDKGGINVIHAASMRGKVVEHILSPDWRKKVKAAFRFDGAK